MATSGGYYVASSGHHIMAQPSTVTGSIGVIMGKIVTGTLLDKIFFGREAISRGKYARILDSEQGFNEEEREIMWEMLTRSYDLFLERVSQSRKKSPEEIDAVSRGRVWTGRQAVENGLADELGGLDLALAKARQLGGLHKHAPVRMILPDRRRIPPAASPVAALEYALEGARIFQWGTTLLLCPYSWDMD
jgi:protease-4